MSVRVCSSVFFARLLCFLLSSSPGPAGTTWVSLGYLLIFCDMGTDVRRYDGLLWAFGKNVPSLCSGVILLDVRFFFFRIMNLLCAVYAPHLESRTFVHSMAYTIGNFAFACLVIVFIFPMPLRDENTCFGRLTDRREVPQSPHTRTHWKCSASEHFTH